uniref:Uncharacterized protein n=1 Tax=Ornithorhynchus anatinus TaxID=9258 RepID=A0A6I8N2Q6_ORNAN
MATVELVDLIQEEVTCPICLGFMKEPVSTDCGHCFCSSCISALLETSGTTPGETHPCPQCRTSFQPETLRHNRHLGNIVAALRLLGPGARPAETLCERHGESLRLFCQEDGKAVCALCDQSREHRGHRTLPVQVAARTYKVRNPAGEEKTPGEAVRAATCPLPQEKVAARRQRVAAEFEKMRSFLEQEEQRQLRELEQEESETLRGLRESEARLVRQNRGLRELIAELESRCQAPPLELLQVRPAYAVCRALY